MAYDRRLLAFGLLLPVVVAGLLLVLGVLPAPWSEERAEVRVLGPDGETKATVDAEVADAPAERYVGLSDRDSLEAGEGMLFVHRTERERTYVMRGMDFGIDIVFVGADGRITAVESAPPPEPGEDGRELRYAGDAKWVLEVPRGYADETGVEVGDRVEIEYRG